MSVRVTTAVYKHSRAKLATRLVLLALSDAAHDDGITWVSQPTLSAKALVNESTVRRCLRELEGHGEVETRKAQRGRQRINVYRVTLPGVADPVYEDLPFKLVETFTTTAQSERSSGSDDRASTHTTTAHPEHPVLIREPSSETSEATPQIAPVPPLMKVVGRNLGFDALAEVCGIDTSGNRAGLIAQALNGGKAIKVGIRELCWREWYANSVVVDDDPVALTTDRPAMFEEYVASRIRSQARAYKVALRGAVLTPTSLAKWWTDLHLQDDAVMSPEAIAAYGAGE